MIWLKQEDKILLKSMVVNISKEKMLKNWRRLTEMAPFHSGIPKEEATIQLIMEILKEYRLEPKLLSYDTHTRTSSRSVLGLRR